MNFFRPLFAATAAATVFFGFGSFPVTCAAKEAFAQGVVESLMLRDNRRARDVPVRVYYPASKFTGVRPVILFSHGAGGSKNGYAYLGEAWAEVGYVCIHPDHAGSNAALVHKGRPLITLRDIAAAVKDPGNMSNRPLDVSFVIDMLGEIEKAVPVLKRRLDTTRIGVAGHSFGAYTTIAVAGATVHLPGGETRNFSDKRVAAFLAMSPQGVGHIGMADDSWSAIERPCLTMSGTFDRELGGGEASERLQPFEHMPAGRKFHVLLENADHMDFADTQFDGKMTPPKFHGFVAAVGLAFWDTYLARANDKVASRTEDFRTTLEQRHLLNGAAVQAVGARGSFQSK